MSKLLILALCVVGVWTSSLVKRQGEDPPPPANDEPAADAVAPVAAPAAPRISAAAPPRPQGATGATGYNLPDAAELVVGNIKTTFSCDGRIYGYYADIDNDCKIFHVCVPVPDETGNPVDTAMYSFFCGNLTVFDQERLVCVHADDGPNCAEAPSHFEPVNSRFGVTDRPQQNPAAVQKRSAHAVRRSPAQPVAQMLMK